MKGDTMRKNYTNNQKANAFVLGFIYKDSVYIKIFQSCNFIMAFAKYDKTSKSHGRIPCLRFRPTAWQKKMLVDEWGAKEFCTIAELDNQCSKEENRGHIFEKLARDEYKAFQCEKKEWWNGGDFVIDGNIYQAKFEGGTFCTAKQCRALK